MTFFFKKKLQPLAVAIFYTYFKVRTIKFNYISSQLLILSTSSSDNKSETRIVGYFSMAMVVVVIKLQKWNIESIDFLEPIPYQV